MVNSDLARGRVSQPFLQRAQCVCSSEHHLAALNITVLLLILLSGGERVPPLAQKAGGILFTNLPRLLLPCMLLPVVPEVLPAAGHPFPCMEALCCP